MGIVLLMLGAGLVGGLLAIGWSRLPPDWRLSGRLLALLVAQLALVEWRPDGIGTARVAALVVLFFAVTTRLPRG